MDLTASVSFPSHTSLTSMGLKCLLGTRRSMRTETSCHTVRTSSVRLMKLSKAVKEPRKTRGGNNKLQKGVNGADRPLVSRCTSHRLRHRHTRITEDGSITIKSKEAGAKGGTVIARLKGIQGIHRDLAISTATRDRPHSIPTIRHITNHRPHLLRARQCPSNLHQ